MKNPRGETGVYMRRERIRRHGWKKETKKEMIGKRKRVLARRAERERVLGEQESGKQTQFKCMMHCERYTSRLVGS